MIIISAVCRASGQTKKINLEKYTDTGNNTHQNEKDTEELIKEFREIMEIPSESRSVEQWNRAIEIIFTIYYGADLTALFRELESELREQTRLKQELDLILNKLNKHIETEKELTEHLSELQNRYELISENLSSSDLGFSFYPYIKAGFTSGIGANVGLGFVVPIKHRIIIGADILWNIDMKNLAKYFSIDFIIGWGF